MAESGSKPGADEFLRLIELLRKRPRTLADYHAAGVLIGRFEPEGGTYGSEWLDTLIEDLDNHKTPVSRSLAYKLHKFATLYGAAEVAQLDGRVSWEVVMRLLTVPDPAQRRTLLKKVVEGKLASRAVGRLLQERTYRPARGPRKSAEVPTDPNGALRSLRQVLAGWERVHAVWKPGKGKALSRARKLRQAETQPVFLDHLDEAAGKARVMADQAGSLAAAVADLARKLRERADKPRDTRRA